MQQEKESEAGRDESRDSGDDALPLLKRLHLGVAKQYYSCANALGLGRLQDYFQVHCTFPEHCMQKFMPGSLLIVCETFIIGFEHQR